MIQLYRLIVLIAGPFLPLYLRRRVAKGKEMPERWREKLGHANVKRPKGRVVWLHAASVGEAQSALIVIRRMLDGHPDISILLTTGTISSASFLKKRTPRKVIHQFAPLDHPAYIERFLDHWRPDAALRIESELWPLTLLELQKRRIPMALLNARLSERSVKNWRRSPALAKRLLDGFDLITAQSQEDQTRLQSLTGRDVLYHGNLKYSAAPLAYKQRDYEILSYAVRGRPLWLYASTHDGEEALACRTHTVLKQNFPDLLTVIVPRHPERAKDVVDICDKARVSVLRRGSTRKMPLSATDIYLVDTIGELGLFYALSPIACIGRSFSLDGGGGHNPIEAAQLRCAILHGPDIHLQQEIFDEMKAAGACVPLNNEAELTLEIQALLKDETRRRVLQDNAARFADSKAGIIDDIMRLLDPVIKQPEIADPAQEAA